MRLLWLLATVITAAGIWFYTHPDAGAGLKALLPATASSARNDRLYKWRNARGEWQITDTLPPAGTRYETLDFREDLNVLPVPPQLDNGH